MVSYRRIFPLIGALVAGTALVCAAATYGAGAEASGGGAKPYKVYSSCRTTKPFPAGRVCGYDSGSRANVAVLSAGNIGKRIFKGCYVALGRHSCDETAGQRWDPRAEQRQRSRKSAGVDHCIAILASRQQGVRAGTEHPIRSPVVLRLRGVPLNGTVPD